MASVKSEDGYSGISGETLQTAMRELNENPATRGDAVRVLRDRVIGKEKVGWWREIDDLKVWFSNFNLTVM